ncbi:MAG: flagellar basal body-associated protein FliL [Blastocatellia bacterium]|nr:flagellar basal body-associated protein FliL [Blastocatellia bacterium]
MPKNTTILMIRHAEKPDKGKGLSVAGQERAQAYVIYFQNYAIDGKPIEIKYLFATEDSDNSERPRLTIEPLAKALDLEINAKHKDHKYQELADHILKENKYDDSVLIICWHHGQILQFAQALGVNSNELPAESNWPTSWPEDVFGWLLQISYDSNSHIVTSKTKCNNQQLMYGDFGKDPKSTVLPKI